jgi:glucose-6-phosphate 1-dehydrogenase
LNGADAYAGVDAPDNCTMVLLGASGDLAHRKLVPALFNLALDGLLPARFSVVGYARTPTSDDAFRENLRGSVAQHSRRKDFDEDAWGAFAQGLSYCAGDFDDPQGFVRLGSTDNCPVAAMADDSGDLRNAA